MNWSKTMKNVNDLNLHQWFMEREVKHVPAHFVRTKTPTTQESDEWIREKLIGRYGLVSSDLFGKKFPAFEDPKEALFYELTWS